MAAAKKPVRALVRPTGDESRIEELRRAGVELAMGDLKDPASGFHSGRLRGRYGRGVNGFFHAIATTRRHHRRR
jgi:hypothetical protein